MIGFADDNLLKLVEFIDANQTIRELMRELRQFSKQAVKNVFINLNSEHVKVRISRGISAVSQPEKEIKQEDVERAIQSSKAAKMLPNYKILHTMIREYVVDDIGDIQDPVGMTGSRLEVSTLLVEAFAPHFDMLGRAFEEAGANVNGIIFNPFAFSKKASSTTPTFSSFLSPLLITTSIKLSSGIVPILVI